MAAALQNLTSFDCSDNPNISLDGLKTFRNNHPDTEVESVGCTATVQSDLDGHNAPDKEVSPVPVDKHGQSRHIIFNQAKRSGDEGVSNKPAPQPPRFS
ncbi:MAG: hypothetical protein P1U40_01120 [Coxiellaceae bacterium]|nr:hypothetical protein [Coxiellaceae bacterium]